MGYIVLTLESDINNVSCQIGDNIYANEVTLGELGGFVRIQSEFMKKLGKLHMIAVSSAWMGGKTQLVIDTGNNDPTDLIHTQRAFIAFSKDNRTNLSNMLGHWMQVDFKNNSLGEANLFSVSSEVSISSK